MMRCSSIDAPRPFKGGGRGPSITRWITHEELLFPNSQEGFSPERGDIVGAVSEDAWVLFHGKQVLQIVPDEVHSGWHYSLNQQGCSTNAWRVLESSWLGSFDQQHLAEHHHFILEFYDETVEVICRELMFGTGEFLLGDAIMAYPKLCYAYLRLAMSLEKQGEVN